jgi:hypothetical protein
MRDTVEAGARSRVSFDRSLRDAPGAWSRGLVVDALEKITGLDVKIEGSLRLYPDGVVIQRLHVGDGMTVEKLLVRAQVQPLLSVLDSWKSNPADAAELRIDAVKARGVEVRNVDFQGVRRAFNLFVRAAGPILIDRLSMYDLTLDITAHEAYEGMEPGALCVKQTLRLSSFEFAELDSRMSASRMAGCVFKVDEGVASNLRGDGKRNVAASDGNYRNASNEAQVVGVHSSSSRPRRNTDPEPEPAGNRDPFASVRGLVAKAVMARVESAVSPELVAIVNTGRAVFQSLAPRTVTEIGLWLTEKSGSASLAELGRVGRTGEAFLDAGVLASLLASGFPRRILENGGVLAVKLVESGLGTVLVFESADTFKVLLEKRVIDRVLDLDLMDALLDRPELTKTMFRSGVVEGALRNGVLDSLLRRGKENVCVNMLRGSVIETLMVTGLLPAMMTFEVPGDEASVPPPTGSVDDS